MWLSELFQDLTPTEPEELGNNWWYQPEFDLYMQMVGLTIPVPCCGRRDPTWTQHICKLPPGHDSADIPCMSTGAGTEGPIYWRIVKVTTHHPERLKPWECASILDADAILSMDS